MGEESVLSEQANVLEKPIAEYETAYAAFKACAETYPADLRQAVGVTDEWSAQDVIAHLNGWFVEGQRRFKRFPRGTGKVQYNVDTFNKVSLWLRESKDYDDLLEELDTLSTEFVTSLQALPPARIERESRYADWLEDMTREMKDHRAQMMAFLEQQGV